MIAASESTCTRPLTGRMVLICLVAFFAVISMVNGIMIRAAITTFGGVETGSAYQAGQDFKHEAQALRAQDALHWRVKASVRLAGGKTVVEIDASDAADRPIAGLAGTALRQRPTSSREDLAVALSEDSSGHFRGAAGAVVGQWDVLIELSRGGERIFRSRNRVVVQ